MAIEFSCPRCDTRYKAPDSMAGKRVTCKSCGQERTVPPAVAEAVAVATRPTRPAPPVRERVLDDFDEVDDVPAYRPQQTSAMPPKSYDSYDESPIPARPRPAAIKRARPRRPPAADFNPLVPIGIYLFLAILGYLITTGLAAIDVISPRAGHAFFFFGALLVSFGMLVIGQVGLLVVAFREGVAEGLLCIFVPFYTLYYLITRWADTKRPFTISFTGSMTIVAGAIVLPMINGDGLAFRSLQARTARTIRAEPILTEYAQSLEELHGVLAEIRDSDSAQRLQDRLWTALMKAKGIEDRYKEIGPLTLPEHNTLKGIMGGRMREVMTALILDGRRLEFVPEIRAMMITLQNSIARNITAWDGTTPPEGNAGGQPALAQGPAEPAIPAHPDPAIPDNADAVAKSLLQLQAANVGTKKEGLQRLERTRPDGRLDEVVAAILPLLGHDDGFLVDDALKALAVWHTPEVVPPVIDRLGDNRFFVRHEAIKTLGKLKDPRALEPLLGRFSEDGFQVKDALKAFGPGAEPALIGLLRDPDAQRRRDALEVLKDTGGMDTLITMRDLPTDTDGIVRILAQEAWKSIARRVGEPPPPPKKTKEKSPFTPKGRSKP